MSFRHGAKGVMRNPKPCSIKTTTLINLMLGFDRKNTPSFAHEGGRSGVWKML